MGMCMYLKVLSRPANFILYKMPKIIKYHHKQNLDIQPTVCTICPFKGEKAENEAQCILGSLGGLLEIDLFKKKKSNGHMHFTAHLRDTPRGILEKKREQIVCHL